MVNDAAGLKVAFDITSSSGGVPQPGSWVGFNPQPEPPALAALGGGTAFGFMFDMTSLSSVTLALRVIEVSSGDPIRFEQIANPIPLPPTVLLLSGAVAVLLRRARRT